MTNVNYAAIVTLCLGLSGCTRISPGYVGIKSTSAGTGRGMQDVAVGPAWVFYNIITESVFEYPTSVQQVVWSANKSEGNPINEEISFTNADQMQINADISLAYSIMPDHAADFYIKFRSDNLTKFTMGYMRNVAREKFDNSAGKYHMDQIMGDNAIFLTEVRMELQDVLLPIGVKLEQFGFIGAPRPPAMVTEAISAKIHATQLAMQKQNELVQAEADAKKVVAQAEGDAKATLTRAEAQATANRKLAESITPSLIEYRKLEKWNGVLPTVQSGSGGIMLGLPAR